MNIKNLLSLNKIFCFYPVKIIATFFGFGLVPVAPGTVGSFVTLIFLYLLGKTTKTFDYIFLFPFNLIFLAILYVIGYLVTHKYILFTNKHDPKEVVIDEVLGQSIAVVMAWPVISIFFNANEYNLYNFIIITFPSFVLFRIFDIWKPYLIGWIDKNMNNAHGVMLDDTIAGIFAVTVIYTVYLSYKLGVYLYGYIF